MPYKLNERIKNLTPYEPIHGEYAIRLDANESYFALDDTTKDSITKVICELELNRYPDSNATKVCESFADFYGIPAKNVTAGNGSDELIGLIVGTFLSSGQKLLSFSDDFSMYRFYASTFGYDNYIYQKQSNLTIDIDRVINTANTENIGAVIFSNPCNPTSLLLDKVSVVRLIKSVSCLVVLDEAYMDFCTDDVSLIREFDSYPNLIILKTASKAVGAAGIRLGFAVANDNLTRALKSVKSPYNVNAVTQAIGEVIYSNPVALREKANQIIRSTRSLHQALKIIFNQEGEVVYDTTTNFVFIKTKSAKAIFEGLKGHSIAVRCMGDYLRITTGSALQNESLIKALKAVREGV